MAGSDTLDPDRIQAHLDTHSLGTFVRVFKSTSSTSDIAAEYARNEDHHGWVVFAEYQSRGRGRAGNSWHSAPGDGLLCSVVLTKCRLRPELLSLMAAVATAEAIGCGARIKWPNDILINGKKVCGILLESRAFAGHTAYILGMGINCHQQGHDFPRELQSYATSLDIETHTVVDRTTLARRLLVCLEQWIETAEGDPDKVVEQWYRMSVQLGHRVTVIYNGQRFSGHCIGVDPERGLMLQLDRGGVRLFDAAHSSIARR
jgi:BirA family biotin operon repressor/biotin-[acetyl-CoA-carboxylase] ligase